MCLQQAMQIDIPLTIHSLCSSRITGYGFNPGSALLLTATENTGLVAALAAANTSLSASCGAVSALFTNMYIQERTTGEYSFDLTMAMNGALGGLVAITAPCGTVESWAACCIGIVAGWIYLFGSKLLIKLMLDDAVDAIPVHMFNGIWGLIATGLFSSPRLVLEAFGTDEHVGWFYSLGRGSFDGTLLLLQVIEILFIIGWATASMLPFFIWLNYMGWFRADSLEESLGLDAAYHGGNLVVDLDRVRPKGMERKRGTSKGGTFEDDHSWTDLTVGPPETTDHHSVASDMSSESGDAK
jgi:Amt family ammonium transporter